MVKSLITAFRTLTILPVPGKDTDNFSQSLPFFPVIGFLLGAVVYGIFRGSLIIKFDQTLIVVIIALFVETVLTGALHIDGLGDVADGFGAGKAREEILAIFKDSRMGTFGICAIVFDLIIKTACWNGLFEKGRYSVIIFSLVFSRCIQILYLAFLPNARKNGILAPFTKSSILIKISALCSVAISIALSIYFLGLFNSGLYIISVLCASLLFGIFCMKKIGGITGDCVGAVNEISEIAVLFTGILLSSYR